MIKRKKRKTQNTAEKRTRTRQVHKPLEILLKALTTFYPDDSLNPGVNLSYMGEDLVYTKNGYKKAHTWYGSISRYVPGIEDNKKRIIRITPHKIKAATLEKVVQELSLEWYNSISQGMSELEKIGFSPKDETTAKPKETK